MKSEKILVVNIEEQRADLFVDQMLLWVAPVSTSALGLGEEPNSYKTPRGLHRVVEKIGDSAPIGTVFKGRKPTGEVWTPESPKTEEDLILTRILWLEGAEAHNKTSRDRYIYIHGTNDEAHVGVPVSKGCIRLKNADVIALFEWLDVGSKVDIRES